MERSYLPLEHHYKLIKDHVPKMRWDGKEYLTAWQKRAREKPMTLWVKAKISPTLWGRVTTDFMPQTHIPTF